jgi:pseudouridine kinase
VVVGGANLDLLATCDTPARLGDSNPGRLHSSPGGVARNIAQRLAELGRPVRLLAALGDDDAGRELQAHGEAAGVQMDGCVRCPGERTARYLALHQPDGELLVAVNDMAVTAALTPERLAAEQAALHAAPAVVLETNLEPATLAALWALPVPLWADPVSVAKCERLRVGLARLHTVKPDRAEALQLSGLPADTPDADLAAWFHHQGVQQVALSLGPQGLLLSRRAADGSLWQHRQAALNVAVRSVNGAGDALLAGLLHAQLQGLDGPASAACAVACAARALTGQPLHIRAGTGLATMSA